jgi:hypothetical protein
MDSSHNNTQRKLNVTFMLIYNVNTFRSKKYASSSMFTYKWLFNDQSLSAEFSSYA